MRIGVSRTIQSFSIAFALVLGISACSNASRSLSAGEVTTGDAAESDSSFESPLNEYLSLVLGIGHSPAESLRWHETRNMHRESLIAQCMHENGFDFELFVDRYPLPIQDGEPWRRDDPVWVAEWGYGMQNPNPEPGTIPVHSTSRGILDENDPNVALLVEMSQSEADAWNRAFWGESLENYGCLDTAELQLQEEQPGSIFETEEFRPLFNAWRDMMMVPPGISDADLDWANCMADAGHPGFAQQSDAATSIALGLHNATGSSLAELRQKEIELALIDLNCRNAVDYTARQNADRLERETQFVNDHRAELEALRDAAEQRGIEWSVD